MSPVPEVGEAEQVEFGWHEGPPRPGTAELFESAHAVDAEMDFSSPAHSLARASGRSITAEIRTTLHRWGTPRPSEPQLAAVLTMWKSGSLGWAMDIVVDPRFRSTGVATAVFERLGPEVSGLSPDFDVTGQMSGCAFGSHPAAERMARRVGAALAGRRDRLLLPSRAVYEMSRIAQGPGPKCVVTEVGVGGVVPPRSRWRDFEVEKPGVRRLEVASAEGTILGDFRISRSDGPAGATGEIHDMVVSEAAARLGRTGAEAVLRSAVEVLWQSGVGSVDAAVEASRTQESELFRAAAFQHDRSDSLFVR